MNDLEKSANRAFWLSVGSVVTCCAPVGVVALVWSVLIKRDADMNGQPAPSKLTAAMVLGAISCVMFSVSMYSGLKSQKKRDADLHAVQTRLEGKRSATAIDQDLACGLVTEHLLGHWSAVSCPNPVEPSGDGARLSGVVASRDGDEKRFDLCLARGERWFVIGSPVGGVCPSTLPARVPGNDAAEKQARDAFVVQQAASARAAYREQLIKMRGTVAKRVHAPSACPAFDAATISYVDFDLLNADKQPDEAWSFLSKRDVRDALAKEGALDEDTAAVFTAPALAVFSSEDRLLPVPKKDKGILSDSFSYEGGSFEGWLTLVDPKKASVLCETAFSFESGKSVHYRKSHFTSEEHKVEETLHDDLQDQFKDAAAAAMQKLTGGKLKLGVKLLE